MNDTRPNPAVALGVVDPDEVVRGVITEHVRDLDDTVVGYQDLASFTDSIDASKPGVVVFGPTASPTDVITQVAGLVAFRPGCSAIMVVYELTAAVLQQALRSGVDDVVAG
jgi:DNA-binding NtrC family response regulator